MPITTRRLTLVAGAVDFFEAAGIPGFGPSKAAATMEGSKTFSKDFMKRHGIPTAAYENFTDYNKARAYLDSVSHNVVIKASGLAAGKGVIVCKDTPAAKVAVKRIMVDEEFGARAGRRVVIEKRLDGEEVSVLALVSGRTVLPLPVGARSSVDSPRAIAAQPFACASVGASKEAANHSRTAG